MFARDLIESPGDGAPDTKVVSMEGQDLFVLNGTIEPVRERHFNRDGPFVERRLLKDAPSLNETKFIVFPGMTGLDVGADSGSSEAAEGCSCKRT